MLVLAMCAGKRISQLEASLIFLEEYWSILVTLVYYYLVGQINGNPSKYNSHIKLIGKQHPRSYNGRGWIGLAIWIYSLDEFMP